MATAVSTKPAAHPGKMKRPPPPAFVQTGVNGAKPRQSISSPINPPNKPAGSKRPASPVQMTSSTANGVNGRQVAKARSHKAVDASGRPQRLSLKLNGDGPDGPGADRRQIQRQPEPYVKTTSYVLKKYAKCQPSLIIHLHPTHFRFENQDGSFPYNSEMKVVIEHLKEGTVPHDMMEELVKGGVRFYEGCLIVRVVDHRSRAPQPNVAVKASSTGEKTVPFSVHNYNQHITPSSYVSYPTQNQTEPKLGAQKPANEQNSNATEAKDDANDKAGNPTVTHDMPGSSKPKIFTTVLHPTPRSMHAELVLLSTTPDHRVPARRQSQGYNSVKGPVPASLSQPGMQLQTSSSNNDRGPPAKRQKMLVEPHELQEVEAKMIHATAPSLYLEPVDNFDACQRLLKDLEPPQYRKKPPSPKTRRRTVAELAADEALAAAEERFMLIMDERLEPTASNNPSVVKSATVDDHGGSAPFEPRFSRFKTLENIRLQHEERAKREHERKLQQDHAKRQQLEAEREKRRIMEQRQAEEQAREDNRRQQLAQHAQAQAQLAAAQNRRPPSQGNPALMGTHPQAQQIINASQPALSSPIVRNTTPHVSSPMTGMNQGVPMAITSSAQGAGSPLSASGLQHGHPGVMGPQMVATRSQQGHSAHGTPQMTQGTPAMSHATPIIRNVTPIQRMNHGSPPNPTMAPTPVMTQAMTTGAPMNGTSMAAHLPQRQNAVAQHNVAGHQLTPQQLAQLQANALAHQNIQNQQRMLQHQQQQHQQQHPQQQPHQHQHPQQQSRVQNAQAYQEQLLRTQLAQLQAAQGGQQHPPANIPQITQQQMMAAAAAAGQPQQPNGVNQPRPETQPNNQYSQIYHNHLTRLRGHMANQLAQQYGSPANYPPQVRQQYMDGLAKAARAYVAELMRKDYETGNPRAAHFAAARQALHQQQQQQQQRNSMQ